MLTKLQIEELDKVKAEIEDDRLKLIVKKAIENWKTDVIPRKGDYGVYVNDEKVIDPIKGGCCLLGTAVIGIKSSKFWVDWHEICSDFNISQEEHDSIINGFDGGDNYTDHFWYKIARKIGEIVCP